MESIESSLGGIARSMDEASWPPYGPGVLTDIEKQVADGPLKEILIRMASGITEAHVRLICVYLATREYMPFTSSELAQAIDIMKQKIPPSTDPAILMQGLQEIAQLHAYISEVFQRDKAGEGMLTQAEVSQHVAGGLAAR